MPGVRASEPDPQSIEGLLLEHHGARLGEASLRGPFDHDAILKLPHQGQVQHASPER